MEMQQFGVDCNHLRTQPRCPLQLDQLISSGHVGFVPEGDTVDRPRRCASWEHRAYRQGVCRTSWARHLEGLGDTTARHLTISARSSASRPLERRPIRGNDTRNVSPGTPGLLWFSSDSGPAVVAAGCPLCANSGLRQCLPLLAYRSLI
jgi:hypothetical protein